VLLAVSIRREKQSFEKYFLLKTRLVFYVYCYQKIYQMSGQSQEILSSASSGPVGSQESTDEQSIRFACQSPEIQSFTAALAESLLGEGSSAEGPPFSVEAFRRQAAKVPFYGCLDEDSQRTIHEISSVATRGRVMVDALKRFAAPRHIRAADTAPGEGRWRCEGETARRASLRLRLHRRHRTRLLRLREDPLSGDPTPPLPPMQKLRQVRPR
jgi:hypothetical protein